MEKPENNDEKLLYCSFCGKNQQEVKKLIAGPSVYICDECVELCNDIILEELEVNERGSLCFHSGIKEILDLMKAITPGNTDVIQKIVYILTMHAKKFWSKSKDYFGVTNKSNILLVGPPGVGKKYICRKIAEICNIPFVQTTATEFFTVGNVYKKSCFEELLDISDYDIEKAQKGIVYIDHIDRISHLNKDDRKKDVQIKILSILDGVNLHIGKNSRRDYMYFDTRNVLFICAGSFELSDIDLSGSYQSIISECLNKDNYLPELALRLSTVVIMGNSTINDLVDILTNSIDSPIKTYQKMFQKDGLEVEFTEGSIKAIAKMAHSRNVGLLGVNSILEDLSLDICLALSSDQKEDKITITEDAVFRISN